MPTKPTTIAVKQDDADTVPVEVLATSVRDISRGIKKLLTGPMSRDALALLIQRNTPTSKHRKSYGRRIPIKTINAVLDGVASLEQTFLVKPAK